MPSEVSAFGSDSERPPAERAAMERALDLARRGWGRVAPNPMVGAVILAGDAVVAAGYHAEFGGPHAEVVALRAAGERARGATLVVNLEPCAHHGKTPPCTEAIIAAGVTRVVAAISDPDPDARGGAAAPAARARRVRPARDAQPGRAAREHSARGADVGHVVARRAVVERRAAREQRRARVPTHDVAGRTPHVARRRGPVALVRRGRGAGRAPPRRRSGGPALLGAGAGVARRGRRSGLSRSATAPPRGRAAVDACGAAGAGL